jgi:hypothetical protein
MDFVDYAEAYSGQGLMDPPSHEAPASAPYLAPPETVRRPNQELPVVNPLLAAGREHIDPAVDARPVQGGGGYAGSAQPQVLREAVVASRPTPAASAGVHGGGYGAQNAPTAPAPPAPAPPAYAGGAYAEGFEEERRPGYFERMGRAAPETLRNLTVSFIILIAISAHWAVSHYAGEWLGGGTLSERQQFLVRAMYPVAGVFLLWNLKALE